MQFRQAFHLGPGAALELDHGVFPIPVPALLPDWRIHINHYVSRVRELCNAIYR